MSVVIVPVVESVSLQSVAHEDKSWISFVQRTQIAYFCLRKCYKKQSRKMFAKARNAIQHHSTCKESALTMSTGDV